MTVELLKVRGKLRRLLCSLLAVLMLLPWVMQGAWAAGGTREVKSREIAVVFDNSGSMYDAGNTAWCGAGYAVEVFAAMMNEKDRLSVYPMWPVEAGGKKYSSSSPLTVTPADDLSVIRDMYTPEAWNTPIETITAASQGLASSQADEKWLIVLTDGDTFFENGESMNGSKTEERLEEELTRCNAAENVMYLGIGSVAVMPKVSAGKNVYYADKATTTAEILTKLTAMSNMIFGRDELKLSGDTLEFDLPMSKLILFVQGSGVGDVTLTGSEGKQLNAVSQYAPSYGTRGAGLDYAGVCAVDTSLQGVVATYEDCDAGTYQLSYSGSVTSVGVYYEPDVELSAFLTDEDGQPVDMEALYPGTYRLCYGLADKNGNLTNSKLLGETHYSVRYDINGEEQTLESDESGWVEVTLGSSDHLNADLSATYLNGYRIEKDNAGLGWPLDGLTPTAHPTSRIELKLEAPQTYVVRSQLEEAQPLTATLLLDGQPMPAELLAQTEVTVDGELDCTVTPNGDGTYTIRLSPEQSAADGLRRITVQASGTDEYGEPYQITAEQKLELAKYPQWVRIAVIALTVLLLLMLFLLFMGMKVLPRKIRVSKTNFTVGATAVSGSARTEFSGGGKKKGRLSITSPKYTANPLAKCGMVLELEAVDNRWTRPAERKAKVTAVSAVNGSAVGSIKVGTLVFNRDPATGKLVSTKKTATTEIGNNRACNVSGQVLDSTGIPVPMGLGVTLKFSK